ncbi:MAG: glycoside hydrolase family 88 protein, partial [Pseudomonadota bacterium]
DLMELAAITPAVRQYLIGVLTTQVDALLACQSDGGAWRTLLDDPQSYEEMSATAGFAYALLKGARLGIGDAAWKTAGARGLKRVLSELDATGTLGQVSYGTRMGHDLDFYRAIPIQPTAYGQAMALLCLSEAMNHDDLR